MTFKEIVKKEWPQRPIRINAGSTQIYLGVNCKGLEQMKPEVIEWLDNHKLLHYWTSRKEIELVYKGSTKLNRLVFGE